MGESVAGPLPGVRMKSVLRDPLIWTIGVPFVLLLCSLVHLVINLCRFGA